MTTPRKLYSPRGMAVIKHSYLVGARLNRADLRYKNLEGTNFTNASLRAVDFDYANLRGCKFIKADLSRSSFYMADCEDADFTGSDLSMSYLKAANFKNARMRYCAFRRVIAKGTYFIGTDLMGSDFVGAFLLGARFDDANLERVRNWHKADFHWWINLRDGGPPSYEPKPGYTKVTHSILGDVTIQENAARNIT